VSEHAQQVVGGILAVGAFILLAAIVAFVWFDQRRVP
jgi:hypothetical protein